MIRLSIRLTCHRPLHPPIQPTVFIRRRIKTRITGVGEETQVFEEGDGDVVAVQDLAYEDAFAFAC